MPPKKSKPMFVPEEPPKPLPREEAEKELKVFFKRLETEFKETPKELIEFGADKVKDFLKGNVSWAEMFNVPKKMIRDMVEYGYLQFQTGRYEEAERFFKMLTIMEWNNSYYHSMMGSILQRQKRYGEAVAEYSEAIKLNPQDAVSLTNRGEIYLQHKRLDKAMADFNAAVALDPKKDNKWANRARLLKAKIEQVAALKKKAEGEEIKKKPGKKRQKGL